MGDNRDDDKRKNYLSEKDAGMIHADLQELINTLDQCNRYLDIFFRANGIYDKAADAMLLQLLEGNLTVADAASM